MGKYRWLDRAMGSLLKCSLMDVLGAITHLFHVLSLGRWALSKVVPFGESSYFIYMLKNETSKK
jgi:hypothetical protein